MLLKKQSNKTASHAGAVLNSHNLDFTPEGVPMHTGFDDVYFNKNDGAAESTYVFLEGNHLPERFAHLTTSMIIAELGFGTGLNFFLTAALFQKTAPEGARLTFISFEKYPLSVSDIRAALMPWRELLETETFKAFETAYTPHQAGWQEIQLGGITLKLALGDIATSLPSLNASVDAWFLDGFAPAKNPDMWTADIFSSMAALTPKGGTFATFTAAGIARRGLAEAGFNVARIKGYAHKRHMLVGEKE